MLCLVGQEEDLVLNPLLDREPVQAHENRSNVFIDPSVTDHVFSHILDWLQFADCGLVSPARRLLFRSSCEVTKAWTIFAPESCQGTS